MAVGAMALAECGTKLEEYWTHVAAQDEMPLAGSARIHSALQGIEGRFPAGAKFRPGDFGVDDLRKWISSAPDVAEEFRMLLSVSNKRFYLDLSYRFSREHVDQGATKTICGCMPHTMKKHSTSALLRLLRSSKPNVKERAAEVIADYLVSKGALTVLDLYVPLGLEARAAVREKWLYPKEAQQNETKRRGHGAEGEIARVLSEACIPLMPPNKATNPMGSHDPNVHRVDFTLAPRDSASTFSVDLAVEDQSGVLRLMLLGLVQSSDPGQFGVDKAATNRTIRIELDKHRESSQSTIEMWGLIDGIGYSENVNGTVGPMLEDFDEFIQHKSAYKALLGAHRLGLCRVEAIMYDDDFYSDRTRTQMHEKYGGAVVAIESVAEAPQDAIPIKAGMATVWVSTS